MKRIISVALLLAMLLSMLQLTAGAVQPSDVPGFSAGADILDDKNVKDFGQIILGRQQITLEIPVKWQNFNFPVGAPAPEELTMDVMNNLKLVFSDKDTADLFAESEDGAYSGTSFIPWTRNSDAFITLTPKNIGVASGTVSVVYNDKLHRRDIVSKPIPIKGEFVDPTINKTITAIRDIKLGTTHGGMYINGRNFTEEELQSVLNNVRPGDELIFSLDTDLFDWNPDITYMYSKVRKSTLDNNHISVITHVAAGHGLFETIQIENINGYGYVVVRFNEFYNKTKAKEFDITISLAQKGIANKKTTINLIGDLENDVYDVYKDYDYVYTGDGIVIDAKESARGIKVDLGYGAVVTMNVNKDKKYYARATDMIYDVDREIMRSFPAIRKVLTVYTEGVNEGNAKHVDFEFDRNYYVYDAQGTYLGTTFDKIPFRNKYYFSLQELSAVELEDYQIALFDDTSPININDNPQTGGFNR